MTLDIDWDEQPLGKVPDRQLARELGVAVPTIRKQRVKRGIETLLPRSGRPRYSEEEKRCLLIDWDKQPLGQVTDSSLAAELGVTTDHVREARLDRERADRERRLEKLKVMAEVSRRLRFLFGESLVRFERRLRRLREELARPVSLSSPASPAFPVPAPRPRRLQASVCFPPPGPPAPLAPRPSPSGPQTSPPLLELVSETSPQDLQEFKRELALQATETETVPREEHSEPPQLVAQSERFRDVVSVKLSPHVHRCPICGEETACQDAECDPQLETSDGEPMLYRTCRVCVWELGQESDGHPVPVPGYMAQILRGL